MKPSPHPPALRISRARPSASSTLLTAAVLTFAANGLLGCTGGEAPPPRLPPPPAPKPGAPVVYYKLPFLGKWRVFRTHYGQKQQDQAYALDIMPDGITNRQANAGWACYGQPIVADAPGVVVIAVDGVPDNDPPRMNVYDMHGNFVVIDHQNGEFSLMAHLIPGSLKVRPGTQLQAGMEIGRCGNSGHSAAPHVHWQVMDNANAHMARGIPPRFAPYLRNGSETTELPGAKDTMENK